ncbi:hypothetical protein GMOD_00001461 [Pyrenophora seminiperda CCB06]|uniref:Major facilitator superfamily transporter n=1 Tax=Pyrenophora seminiperda CCB06 TaxID=1302712 RepID=A0A3M7LZ94_9PLEO|nr:hypothetical protein GMOD_00001461 [Pyrenophora seminiperda CCB06]
MPSVSLSESGDSIKASGPFFRSVPFQILVACGVSFTAPGMWDALGGLGAGGAAEPYAVSAANALVYGLFAVVCVAAGAINNRIGLKYGLALGAIGYPLYGAGLYTNNVSANTWFMLFGSALCGISAGFFWAAEAAIIIGYPSPGDRAFYLAVWQTAKALGPIVGGSINLGLNANRKTTGAVSSTTYIVFIVIMCLGLPVALCLSPAHKVWRKDGTRIVTERAATWAGEFKAVGKLFASRRILLLLPAFFISYFYNGFMSTWLTTYFTSYALVFFWQFGGQAFQQFLYWLVGQYATDLSNLSHLTGILRGVEALGQTVAWAMQSEGGANHFVSIGLNFGITVLCIFPTWIVLSELEGSHEVRVTEEISSKDNDVVA